MSIAPDGDVLAQGVEIEIAGHRGIPVVSERLFVAAPGRPIKGRVGSGGEPHDRERQRLGAHGHAVELAELVGGVGACAPIGPVPQRVGAPIAEV